MDTILLLSPEEQKLEKFLVKMGYEVCLPNKGVPLKDLISQNILDLVIVDTALRDEALDMCDLLRHNDATKGVPIICVNNDKLTGLKIKELALDKIEMIPAPCTAGSIIAKAATQLRLRKIAGEDTISATLAESNAALRDHNTRYKQERDQARSIQLGLLPKELPKSEAYELSVSYMPLDEVGGDWYFVNEIDGRISLQVADVTGHGLAAAFVGCMTRLALTAANKVMPGALLKETNRLISPHLPQGNFITVCSVLFNPSNGEILFANGGHPPGLVFNRAENQISQLKGTGFAFGFFEDSDYTEISGKLSKGDIFITYTDGITEAQNRNGEQYGVQRLSDALFGTTPDMSTEQIKEFIMKDFKAFCDGRRLKDDITLILLKVL